MAEDPFPCAFVIFIFHFVYFCFIVFVSASIFMSYCLLMTSGEVHQNEVTHETKATWKQKHKNEKSSTVKCFMRWRDKSDLHSSLFISMRPCPQPYRSLLLFHRAALADWFCTLYLISERWAGTVHWQEEMTPSAPVLTPAVNDMLLVSVQGWFFFWPPHISAKHLLLAPLLVTTKSWMAYLAL